jgi:hypothetical protein
MDVQIRDPGSGLRGRSCRGHEASWHEPEPRREAPRV